MLSDFWLVVQWWGTLFLVGAVAYPLTRRLFDGWHDHGYLFAKAVGMAAVTYLVYLGGVLHVVPFTSGAIWGAMAVVFLIGMFAQSPKKPASPTWKPILIEELFFFLCLLFWSWVKAHEPSIHGLEKFMDYGFTRSILNTQFFPAPDMWFAGSSINYYYFGHTVMAVLTRLSGIDLSVTFNLMLATIFAFCFTMSFSIGKQLLRGVGAIRELGGGLLTAFLATLAGNMQTLYAFTQGYTGEDVKPFWHLLWPLKDVWQKLGEGINIYWYANATRFIPYTIHEFPSYSFVVSDVHGHVLSIPFVLLAIALLIQQWGTKGAKGTWGRLLFYGFLCGVLFATNALDGPIYLGLFIVALFVYQGTKGARGHWEKFAKRIGVVVAAAALTSIPFLMHFKSFVNGVAVNCPPALVSDTQIGPILFEGVEKCQHSPLWMMWLLWGFFVYCGVWLLASKKKHMLLAVFFFFSLALIIFPEFFYFKDIYPMHFRSNTMFKLGYQAFIMFSIVAGYAIVTLSRNKIFLLFLIPQLFLVSIYPIFSVRSYFNSLRVYDGLDGLVWLKNQYPDDWEGIRWLNQQQKYTLPVIVEADGDSYTDYARISAFTGLPTIIGWPVHEWLWRGTYDVVAPRREEVRQMYESEDVGLTRSILESYGVKYVIVGELEREKYTALQEAKFSALGTAVFTHGKTVIYRINEAP
ncbi:hypothetical protein A2363_01570 [Candidatus Gottesmanbacteria bacterium RIFOXYB1_FULL_47_11]|uniref:YYY membrane protein n=1 Tax=Candidatus Gottesmanbacteria bacterium RIFOXYB1_FULL_47_11 TaxID=1798401 RepID=A0A1F6BG53_9BACT|nr:MAG: hypothetical protein A2363_01570 [Candidatus Gottesmanbacteria bacterium RIFOXYB1_FULL_47_11]